MTSHLEIESQLIPGKNIGFLKIPQLDYSLGLNVDEKARIRTSLLRVGSTVSHLKNLLGVPVYYEFPVATLPDGSVINFHTQRHALFVDPDKDGVRLDPFESRLMATLLLSSLDPRIDLTLEGTSRLLIHHLMGEDGKNVIKTNISKLRRKVDTFAQSLGYKLIPNAKTTYFYQIARVKGNIGNLSGQAFGYLRNLLYPQERLPPRLDLEYLQEEEKNLTLEARKRVIDNYDDVVTFVRTPEVVLDLDLGDRYLILNGQRGIRLSEMEFYMLLALFQARGKKESDDYLLKSQYEASGWYLPPIESYNRLNIIVYQLRSKIEQMLDRNGFSGAKKFAHKLIENIPASGNRFNIEISGVIRKITS